MRCKPVLFLGFLLLIGLASASFSAGNFSYQKNYGSGDKFLGGVNINFTNHPINDTFTDNFGNSINLSELLSVNPNYNYTYDNSSNLINSSTQKIYFDNASFYLPASFVENLPYKISLNNQTIISVNISISNSKELVLSELNKKKITLKSITAEIDKYPLFMRVKINTELGISKIQGNLTYIESVYNSTNDYDELLEKINEINIPEELAETETASSISFIPSKSAINLEILQTIGGGSFEAELEESYKDQIIFWAQENLNPKINFKKINAQYNGYEEHLLTYVEITTDSSFQNTFFIIEEAEGLEFENNYNPQTEGNYVYIDLSNTNEKIVFATSENLDIGSIPAFISPSLDQISISNSEDIIDSEKEEKMSKWLLFSLVIILLLIIFIVSYYVLHSWYKKKYEDYLFPNKNSLYNLIVYINNVKRKGMKNDEIEKNLKKAKWTSEQIKYVMKKYAGKRTGMWNPFFKDNSEKQTHKI